MQDNKSLKPDDIIDENDIDITDIEEEADLADDSWDEFDDEETGKTASAKPAKKTDLSGAPKKKSSSFAILIVLLAVVGGGGFFMMQQRGAAPAPDASQETASGETSQNGIVELADNSNPPMPAPIESSMEPAETQDISEDTSAAASPDQPPTQDADLTPLPGASELAQNDLPDLNASKIPAKADETASENIPADSDIQPAPAEELPIAANDNAASDATAAPVEEVTPAPTLDQAVTGTPATDPAVNERITAVEQSLVALRSDLEGKIDSTNDKVDSLVAAIKSLETKLNERPAAAAPKSAPAQEVSSQPEEEPAPAMQEPEENTIPAAPVLRDEPKLASPAPDSPATSETPVTKTNKWTLRSAQPGKAMVSPQGSNEMKAVSVGDTLQGVGRITSIDIENGVWTVRGTKGVVTR